MKKQFVRFDWVIKYMLRDKSNYVIVDGFLTELLGQSIEIQEILESESNKATEKDKFNRVDVLVKNQDGELIIIELQYETELDYFQRILYGTSKLIVEHISKGQQYAKIKKIISVSIVYFDLGIGQDYLYHGTTTFHGMRHPDDILQLTEIQQRLYHCASIANIYPEYYLIKVEKFPNQIKDKLDEWVYFLKNEEILDSFTARGLEEAQEKLDQLKLPEEERRTYEAYLENQRYQKSMEESQKWEGYFAGEASGYRKGKEEGKKESQLELAQKLFNSSLDLDDQSISQFTGLDIEVIQKLRMDFR